MLAMQAGITPADSGASSPVAAGIAAEASSLAQAGTDPSAVAPAVAKATADETQLAPHAMLVVDELGRLELLRGCGLTNALAILDAGPTPQFPHAIAAVRETLLEEARRRFEPRWGEPIAIGPDDTARELVLETAKATGNAR